MEYQVYFGKLEKKKFTVFRHLANGLAYDTYIFNYKKYKTDIGQGEGSMEHLTKTNKKFRLFKVETSIDILLSCMVLKINLCPFHSLFII